MNSSFGEIKAVLADVAEQTHSAYQHAGVARSRLADAAAVLAELGEQHSEPLVPAELSRAVAELENGLRLIAAAATVVADIDARL
ncbi:hypothetical protein ACVGVM_05640 [Pseudonocardia bannensis]|uniref:Uncharacterized protein n=1 Tax=Pseudonocardia bannensis TaxID=630973 RepID=A0A848DJ90_9PSEU|nr:hypothetical protein [Pseudonocardia bannensis]NMH92770.1 hypothetical protein [Pseudonocardia bannensis]